MMVRDGVTSAFELEVGTGDVAAWYAAREGGQIVNYGVSVGHIPARMKVLGDPSKGLLPAGIGGSGAANEAQMADMEAILREGLAQGAVADGIRQRLHTRRDRWPRSSACSASRRKAAPPSHIHMRGGVAGLDTRRSRRRRPRTRRSISSTSTRRQATSSRSFWPRSRRRATRVRTSRPRPIRTAQG